jgi:hypothetical protein
MKKAILWLGTLAWALVGTACAVSTDEAETEEQVGTTSDELRSFHLPGSSWGNSNQQGDTSCADACAAARDSCEAGNGSSGPNEPMEPCDLLYASCIWSCPLIR